jgi:hypothetical protein
MKRRYWVVDLSRQKKFGPHPSKRAAAKARTVVRVVSDMFLEIATNVYIVGEHENDPDCDSFERGSMKAVRAANARLRGRR